MALRARTLARLRAQRYAQRVQLLDHLTAAFNAGVRNHNFTAFAALFTSDATLDWEGVPERGPLQGRDQIAQWYAENPPDDEIAITRSREDGNRIYADFVWRDIPEARGGSLLLTREGDRIKALCIAFGGPLTRWPEGTRSA